MSRGRAAIPISAFILLLASSFVLAESGVEIAVELDNGQRLTAQELRFERRDAREPLDEGPFLVAAGKPDTRLAPLSQVRRIRFAPHETLSFFSDASTLCFNLGSPGGDLPAPTDWFMPSEETEGWFPATLPSPPSNGFFLPGAAWIWTSPSSGHPADESALFRYSFSLPEEGRIASAPLELTASDRIDAAYVNGLPLPLDSETLRGRQAVFDAAPLLRSGDNLLALRAAGTVRRGALDAGLAFRIEAVILPGAAGQPPPLRVGIAAFLANGDVLTGDLAALSAERCDLRTLCGETQIDWNWVDAAFLNMGQPPNRSALGRLTGTLRMGRTEPVESPWPTAYPVIPRKPSRSPGVELRQGEFIAGRPLGLSSGAVAVESMPGGRSSVPLSQIRWIWPNSAPRSSPYRYPAEEGPFFCRLILANGNRLSGILERISSGKLILRTPYLKRPLEAPVSEILDAWFPCPLKEEARAAAPQLVEEESKPPACALIGDVVEPQPADRSCVYSQVNRALAELGIESKWLSATEIVKPGALNPADYPLLINVDQREQYYHSVYREKDGFEALCDYVNAGGSLLHLAAGSPFSFGVVARAGRWLRLPFPGDSLNAALGFGFAGPGDERSSGVRPFELPPNSNARYFFQKVDPSPEGVCLPDQIDFPPTGDARFRPFLQMDCPAAAESWPVYELRDSDGRRYGPAMAVVRYGATARPGNVGIYASHLLFSATDPDGESMVECLIPYTICLISKFPSGGR